MYLNTTAIMVGTLFGFTTKYGLNALSKVPALRRPWEYPIIMVAGGSIFNYLLKKHEENENEIDTILKYLNRHQVDKKE